MLINCCTWAGPSDGITPSAENVGRISRTAARYTAVSPPLYSCFLELFAGEKRHVALRRYPRGCWSEFLKTAALQHGKVAAAVAGPLGVALLSKQSSPVILADCRTEAGARAVLGTSALPSSSLMVGAEWARSHPEIARKLGNAVRRSLAWIQAHSREDISRSCRFWPTTSPFGSQPI
jgi:hypothetical protein